MIPGRKTGPDLAKNSRLSVAPMMDWTDRHCRYFHRVLSRHALLYTEMVTSSAILHGDRDRLLAYDAVEHPVALQLGGSDPEDLAEATRIAVDHGFDEVNLNVGCPSDRVQSGAFGAVLMKSPDLVAKCVSAMRQPSQGVPVTVKCRIGVDDQVPEEILPNFLKKVAEAGSERVTIHARMAWLEGLSPKQNRDIPPLNYPLVAQMKSEFPDLWIGINGGIASLEEARGFLDSGLDGVMIGRRAYHDPANVLLDADKQIFDAANPCVNAEEAAEKMLPYIEREIRYGTRLQSVTRHMLGLFSGRPGARHWRRILSENAYREDAGVEVVRTAMEAMMEFAS